MVNKLQKRLSRQSPFSDKVLQRCCEPATPVLCPTAQEQECEGHSCTHTTTTRQSRTRRDATVRKDLNAEVTARPLPVKNRPKLLAVCTCLAKSYVTTFWYQAMRTLSRIFVISDTYWKELGVGS